MAYDYGLWLVAIGGLGFAAFYFRVILDEQY